LENGVALGAAGSGFGSVLHPGGQRGQEEAEQVGG